MIYKKSDDQFRLYTLISMAYITSIIASIIFFNKFIAVGPLFTSASLISYSLTYFFGNAISEVYGFKLAKKLIWSTIICGNAFTLYCNLILMIPSPTYKNHDAVLSQVIGGSLRASIAGTIAMIAGAYTSSYIVSKSLYFSNKTYWTRGFIASSTGELVNTLIVFPVGMLFTVSFSNLTKVIISAYICKLTFVLIQIIPYTVFIYFLKQAEGMTPNTPQLSKLRQLKI